MDAYLKFPVLALFFEDHMPAVLLCQAYLLPAAGSLRRYDPVSGRTQGGRQGILDYRLRVQRSVLRPTPERPGPSAISAGDRVPQPGHYRGSCTAHFPVSPE